MERVEAAKKQVELAASSEDPEVPELLGGNLQSLGPRVDHIGDFRENAESANWMINLLGC